MSYVIRDIASKFVTFYRTEFLPFPLECTAAAMADTVPALQHVGGAAGAHGSGGGFYQNYHSLYDVRHGAVVPRADARHFMSRLRRRTQSNDAEFTATQPGCRLQPPGVRHIGLHASSSDSRMDGGVAAATVESLAQADVECVYAKFMSAHACYDLIPTSSKLVVFDTQLLVKKAFYALVYNGVRSAPLWDSARQAFVGMLTITDFISILQKYYRSPLQKMDELEEHKIDTWRQELRRRYRPLVSIAPTDTLYDAVRALSDSKVHRLPVICRETGNALHILTHKRLLRFLYLYMRELPVPAFMARTLGELRLGTYSDLATVTPDTPVIVALKLFVDRRVSALPVLDAAGRAVNVYAKFDVINLAAERTYNNLDVSVNEALMYRLNKSEKVFQARKTDTLGHVIETIVLAEVHRLVVVDLQGRVEGVISLSDILSFLVLVPHDEDDDAAAGGATVKPPLKIHIGGDEDDEGTDQEGGCSSGGGGGGGGGKSPRVATA